MPDTLETLAVRVGHLEGLAAKAERTQEERHKENTSTLDKIRDELRANTFRTNLVLGGIGAILVAILSAFAKTAVERVMSGPAEAKAPPPFAAPPPATYRPYTASRGSGEP